MEELREENERLRNALKHIASRYEESEHAPTWMTAWAMHSDAIQALEEDYEFGDRGYDERREEQDISEYADVWIEHRNAKKNK